MAASGEAAGGVWAVVLAAGRGARFGGPAPKQFLDLDGATLVARAVSAVEAVATGVVVVVPASAPPTGLDHLTVTGGDERADSVRAGLCAVPADAEVVVIHDAAHPLASPALVRSVVSAVAAGADGAMPVVPLTEVLKSVTDDEVVADVAKHGLVLGQTPCAFRASVLRAAHAGDPYAVEDVELVRRVGGRVVTVPGDPVNIHVSTERELAMAAALLAVPPS